MLPTIGRLLPQQVPKFQFQVSPEETEPHVQPKRLEFGSPHRELPNIRTHHTDNQPAQSRAQSSTTAANPNQPTNFYTNQHSTSQSNERNTRSSSVQSRPSEHAPTATPQVPQPTTASTTTSTPQQPQVTHQSAPTSSSNSSAPGQHSAQQSFGGVVRYGLPKDEDSARKRQQLPRTVIVYGLIDVEDSDDDDFYDDDRRADRLAAGMRAQTSIGMLSPLELLQELQSQLTQKLVIGQTSKAAERETVVAEAERKLASDLAAVEAGIRAKELELQRSDEAQRVRDTADRDARLQALKLLHEKTAALQQQQVEKAQKAAAEAAAKRAAEEEARRRAAEAEAARKRAEAEAEAARKKAHEEADAKRKAEEAAQAAQAEAQRKAAADAEAKRKAEADKPKKHPCLRITPEASAQQQRVLSRMAELDATMKALKEDDSLKKSRRDIEKKMTIHVQQISATIDQVQKKCGDVYQLINQQSDPAWRNYAMLMFATKVIRQYELIQLNNKAAFPLATVLVKVSTVCPGLMDIFLAQLLAECVLVVPKAYEHDPKQITEAQYCKRMGYQEQESPTDPTKKVYEGLEEYLKRVEGCLLLYGAVVQVEDPNNPHGIAYGWQWLARAVNSLPADRTCGKALACFLRTAGFVLYRRYRGQFVKLLACMRAEYLPGLAHTKDSETQAVRTQLAHYVDSRQYLEEPEGHAMPQFDISSVYQ